jgi:hypothetical protein
LGTGSAGIDTTQGAQLANVDQALGTNEANVFNNATNAMVTNNNTATQGIANAGASGLMAGQQAAATGDNAILHGLGSLLQLGGVGTGPGTTLGGSAVSGLGGLLASLGKGVGNILAQ